MNAERSLTIVRRHRAQRVPAEAAESGPCGSIALVLSTRRSASPDLFLDHELWLACMAPVAHSVGARASEVYGESAPRLLERFRATRRGPLLGTLDAYGERLRSAGRRADDAVECWNTVLWRDGSARVIATATCEPWYRVGGPTLYHDSYTTSLLVPAQCADGLVEAIERAVAHVGGVVEAAVQDETACVRCRR